MKIRQLFLLFFLALALLAIAGIPIGTQVEIEAGGNNPFIAGRNVNMVSGTKLPFGDPWLQRQNEPSIAVSTRNPMHLFAGANDYRTIDVPDQFELPGIQAAANAHDAWLGVYESFDGGQSWITTLLHGYPQDFSLEGLASPINGFETACDPIVRAGANGLFYYCGIAFNRTTKASAIFVARYVDNNNLEKVEVKIDQGVRKYFGPIQYIDTKLVATGSTSSSFIDMPNLAVDIPRKGALYGNIYVAYTVFESGTADKISFQRSTDGGVGYGTPVQLSTTGQLVQRPVIAIDPSDLKGNTVYVAFRRFARGTVPNGIVIVKSNDGGKTFGRPSDVAALPYPFDQGTSNYSFRTNSYPTMAVDGLGKVYVAWSQRQGGPSGQARIVISAIPKINLLGGVVSASDDIGNVQESGAAIESNNFQNVQSPDFQLEGSLPVWSTPKVVDKTYTGIGHQFMPSLTFAGGKLMLAWYDQREDLAKDASNFIEDSPGDHRHTIDVRAAEGTPGVPPSFSPSIQLSRYLYVLDLDSNGNPIEEGGYYKVIQAESNPINYPLFQLGTVPFHGDYMEITPSPRILPPAVAFGYWIYNVNPLEPTIFHAAWADNRDVRPPNGDIWGDWVNYSAPNSAQDSGWEGPSCSYSANTGMRNQNVYTANINKGIIVGSPGNTKQLDLSSSSEGGRTFVVFIKNTTDLEKSLSLQILEIGRVKASFDQFKNDDNIKVKIRPHSSVSTTVYVDRSTRSLAPVRVNASEDCKLMGYVILNPDPTNLPLSDPNNPFQNLGHETHNPDVSAPIVWSYDLGGQSDPDPSGILTPRVQNPRVQNYSVVNPRVQNTGVLNPRVQNESIVNNEVGNPRVQNTVVPNGALTDVTWTVTNDGNTTSAYTFNIQSNVPDHFNSPNPPLIAQVLVYKVHKVPVDKDCQLLETHQDELMVNISNPRVQNPRVQNSPPADTAMTIQDFSMFTQAADLSAQDVTFHLAPGDQADVIFRVWDQDTTDGRPTFNPNMVIAETVAEAVNTDDVEQGITTPSYDDPPNPTPWTTPSSKISAAPEALSFSGSLGGGNPDPQTLEIWNSAWVSGGENLSYTIENDASWLTVNPIAGTTSSANHVQHTVSVNTTGHGAGTYSGTITIQGPLASNNPLRIPVTLTISSVVIPAEWFNRFGSESYSYQAVAMALDSSGNTFVTGIRRSTGGEVSNDDYCTIKINNLGVQQWEKTFDGGSQDKPAGIVVDSAGDVIVTGSSINTKYPYGYDYATIKYSGGNGNPLWLSFYDGANHGDDYAKAIAVDSAGNVFVTGSSMNSGGNNDFVTQRYSGSNGAPLWTATYAGPSNGDDEAVAIALDPAGNVFVTGSSNYGSSGGYINYATIKYGGSNGNQLWAGAAVYDGREHTDDIPHAMAVDSSGNVIVTGSSNYGSGGGLNYATIKYNGSNGDPFWTDLAYGAIYDGSPPRALDDVPAAVAVDSSGDIYVTGYSERYRMSGEGEYFYLDFTTIKYLGGDGSESWVAEYIGPGGEYVGWAGEDHPVAIAVDSSKNVYVTGYSRGMENYDYVTVRYDTDGNECWVRRYDNGGADEACSMALDSSGNFYVAGTSDRWVNPEVVKPQYCTIKYNPLGPPIITVAGGGLANPGNDGPATSAQVIYPNKIALDSSGNLYISEDFQNRIRRVDGATGIITAYAGTGAEGYSGDGGPATSATLKNPAGIACDSAGNLYIADSGNDCIRRVDAVTGMITTLASLSAYDLTVDSAGDIYVADGDRYIKKVDHSTLGITTVAGSETKGFGGDESPAISASLNGPLGVEVDGSGNIYIADSLNNRVRKVDTSGTITTVAGTGAEDYNGDGILAINANLAVPRGVCVDYAGNIFIAEYDGPGLNCRVRKVNASTGIIITVAGTGNYGNFNGDGIPAISADINHPADVVVDANRNIFIAAYYNGRVRKVCVVNN